MIKCEEAEKLLEKSSRREGLNEKELADLQEHISICPICGKRGFIGFDIIRETSKKIAKKYDEFALDESFTGKVINDILTGASSKTIVNSESTRNLKYEDLEEKRKNDK